MRIRATGLLLVFLVSDPARGVFGRQVLRSSPGVDGAGEAKLAGSIDSPAGRHPCLNCHGDGGLAPGERDQAARAVDWQALASSAHGSLACGDCHGQFRMVPHPPFARLSVDCGRCHRRAAESLTRSGHAAALGVSPAELPSCVNCHGGHAVLPLGQRVGKARQELDDTCLGCHTSEGMAARFNVPRSALLISFRKSSHPVSLASAAPGSLPSCSDCHHSHESGPLGVGRVAAREAEFCGRCHEVEFTQWAGSTHARRSREGRAEAVSCSGCHGEHRLRLWAREDAAASRTARPCSVCHEPRQVEAELALNDRVRADRRRTYHGTFKRFGRTYVRDCKSCHGYHDVRQASDQFSPLRRSALGNTCGRCHGGDEERFSTLIVHVARQHETEPPAWMVVFDSPWIWPIAAATVAIGGLILVFGYVLLARLAPLVGSRSPPEGRRRGE